MARTERSVNRKTGLALVGGAAFRHSRRPAFMKCKTVCFEQLSISEACCVDTSSGRSSFLARDKPCGDSFATESLFGLHGCSFGSPMANPDDAVGEQGAPLDISGKAARFSGTYCLCGRGSARCRGPGSYSRVRRYGFRSRNWRCHPGLWERSRSSSVFAPSRRAGLRLIKVCPGAACPHPRFR